MSRFTWLGSLVEFPLSSSINILATAGTQTITLDQVLIDEQLASKVLGPSDGINDYGGLSGDLIERALDVEQTISINNTDHAAFMAEVNSGANITITSDVAVLTSTNTSGSGIVGGGLVFDEAFGFNANISK